MKQYLNALRLRAPKPTRAAEAPTKWLDGSARYGGARDTHGQPVDLPRAAADLNYYKAKQRDAVLAEKARLNTEKLGGRGPRAPSGSEAVSNQPTALQVGSSAR